MEASGNKVHTHLNRLNSVGENLAKVQAHLNCLTYVLPNIGENEEKSRLMVGECCFTSCGIPSCSFVEPGKIHRKVHINSSVVVPVAW